mgnify:FL=1
MSNKLAKVLLICALVVCIPMFIAGTVLAVYYSRNASFDVAVYIDNAGRQYGDTQTPTITSTARTFTSNADDETAQYDLYTVTNCHVEDIQISFNATGYDFAGWFEGTYDEYITALEVNAGEVDYITNNAVLTTTTAEHEHLTAVFNVVRYNVDFSFSDPEFVPSEPSEGEEPQTPPVYTDPIPDDGITDYTFEYNQELPTLENTINYLFMGWTIEGDETNIVYTRANFPVETRDVVLNAVWDDVDLHTFTVNYVDIDGSSNLTSNTLIDINLDEYTLVSTDDYQDENVGYTLSWVIGEGDNERVVTEITSDMLTRDEENNPQPITLRLKREIINRTVTIAVSEEVTYNGEATSFVANVENQANVFDELFAVDNWTHNVYPISWTFIGVKVGENEFATATELWEYISENGLTEVEVTGVMAPRYNEFVVEGGYTLSPSSLADNENVYIFEHEIYSPINEINADYYVDVNSNIKDYLYAENNDGSTPGTAVGLFANLNFNDETFIYYDLTYNEEEQRDEYFAISPYGFAFDFNGSNDRNYNISEITNMYQLIEMLAADLETVPEGTNNTITISNLTILFERV